eukprot:UN28377
MDEVQFKNKLLIDQIEAYNQKVRTPTAEVVSGINNINIT